MKEKRRVGKYAIKRLLGRGGMGAVYLAVQEALGREVALKVLPESTVGTHPDLRRRFEREAASCAKLSHPNVVTIFDFGVEDGTYYYAMALIEGQSLDELLKEEPRQPLSKTLRVAREVADAFAHYHPLGIVHRDLKPANIMIDGTGRAVLTDFGLVRDLGATSITRRGAVVGTPLYLPPEVVRGQPATASSDIYQLGIVLYEMCTGRRPFDTDDRAALMRAIVFSDPEPPSAVAPTVPRGLENLILNCLEKDVAIRYTEAAEILDDLAAIARGEAVARRRPAGGTDRGTDTPAGEPVPPRAPVGGPSSDRRNRAASKPATASQRAPGAVGSSAGQVAGSPATKPGNDPARAATAVLSSAKTGPGGGWVIPAAFCAVGVLGLGLLVAFTQRPLAPSPELVEGSRGNGNTSPGESGAGAGSPSSEESARSPDRASPSSTNDGRPVASTTPTEPSDGPSAANGLGATAVAPNPGASGVPGGAAATGPLSIAGLFAEIERFDPEGRAERLQQRLRTIDESRWPAELAEETAVVQGMLLARQVRAAADSGVRLLGPDLSWTERCSRMQRLSRLLHQEIVHRCWRSEPPLAVMDLLAPEVRFESATVFTGPGGPVLEDVRGKSAEAAGVAQLPEPILFNGDASDTYQFENRKAHWIPSQLDGLIGSADEVQRDSLIRSVRVPESPEGLALVGVVFDVGYSSIFRIAFIPSAGGDELSVPLLAPELLADLRGWQAAVTRLAAGVIPPGEYTVRVTAHAVMDKVMSRPNLMALWLTPGGGRTGDGPAAAASR